MKKKIIVVVSALAILLLVLGGMFLIDKNRMDNNKPVIFSTWGYDYAPPEENPYDNDADAEFNVTEYVKDIQEYILQAKESKTFDIALTEEIYGKEITEYIQTLEIEDVWGSISTDEKSFVTIIPMPDFLDNQTYYFKEDKLVAYKEDFMGIGGSVTYYFKDNEIVFIDESKIEEEMVFEAESANDIIERSNNVYEKIFKAKNVTIPVKEKEDLVITLLDGWKYEFSGDATDEYEYAVKFYKSDEERGATLYSKKGFFGVCGTELETKELYLDDGNKVSVGYYGDSGKWSYVLFYSTSDEHIVANNGLASVEESNELLSMFKTLKFIKTHPGNIAVTERSFIATIIEEEPTYLIVEPNDGEIEKLQSKTRKILISDDESGEFIRDYIYGVGRKVIITYNPIIQSDTNVISGADIDVDGYDDFEITVVKSANAEKRKILNNREVDKLNSDYDLYYYGLEEVNVKVNNKEMTFENALREGYITLSGLLTKANRDGVKRDSYDDGGSTRFHYEDYTIIKYNTLDGNHDLYICPLRTSINDLNK